MMRQRLVIPFIVLFALAVAASLVYAGDSTPREEPVTSPYFDATLQQAVDELDGKVQPAVARQQQPNPTEHYTTDPNVWPECEFGFTRDLRFWPWCHYTSDPQVPACTDVPPWPTMDYTADPAVWPGCGPVLTQDPGFWCDPLWTIDPAMAPQCDPVYTKAPDLWPQCSPRYTTDPAVWPWCGDPLYTQDPVLWPECGYDYTSDPYVWPECHFTSDPADLTCVENPYPTQDYTSNPGLWPGCPIPDPEYTLDPTIWPWCNPEYTTDPQLWPECDVGPYTMDPGMWPWCNPDPLYTSEPVWWPECHYTSDPALWVECTDEYPTKDYTWDADLWPECDLHTTDPGLWPWCDPALYTTDPMAWPWCNPAWTWDPGLWPECEPGYTNDPQIWPECSEGLYTTQPATWPECGAITADARVWPECHYTSDPRLWPECLQWKEPTKDYTTDPEVWPECAEPVEYTSDPVMWPECHYTSDPVTWPSACVELELGDLGDAPDSTNHAGVAMTAYPPGGPGTGGRYPTVFDPATGTPQGPKHLYPRNDAWLGLWATLEDDADLMPDEEGLTNIDPPTDAPDRDAADDGLLYPVNLPNCTPTVISYTVTVSPGAAIIPRYVNVWFDWNRDGDWEDIHTCQPTGAPADEWAVQNQVINLGPGVHVLQTPFILPYHPAGAEFDPIWMRISIAAQPAPQTPGTAHADGRGPANGYRLGETEDYYLTWPEDLVYDIYMKDNPGDLGSVPSAAPWYASPDIWVRNDGDCTQTTPQNPQPGTTTTICTHVRNRLATAVDNITVNNYWATSALGLTWPGTWSYIGSFNVPNLPGGASIVRSMSWNVPNISGHFCLRARADAAKDPIGSGPDTVAPVDKVPNNNNIIQTNVNIVETGPEVTHCGFYSTTVATDTLYLDAINPLSQTVSTDIQFDSSDFPAAGVLLVDPGALWGRWSSLTNFTTAGGQLQHSGGFPASINGINMMPKETAPMTLTIAARIDKSFAIDVSEYVNGNLVGGIQYVRIMPDCLYLPVIMRND